MKLIKGHKSWDRGEIIEMLRVKGSFTYPDLPHWRYRKVQEACRRLERLGAVKRSGGTHISVNLKPTPFFKEWADLYNRKVTVLGFFRWAKQQSCEEK